MRTHQPQIPKLGDHPGSPFPDLDRIGHAEGLIAWGGDLSSQRLLNAYRQGIFPWFEPRGPIMWWSPDPRPVLIPGQMRIPRRLRRELRQGRFRITLDRAFPEVIAACAAPRRGQPETWITAGMQRAYTALHTLGHAHSLEVWQPNQAMAEHPDPSPRWALTGGLYGVAIGKIFFAESKFHRRTNASKIALAAVQRCLEQWGFLALDCQVWNPHLERLGARLMSRADFRALLQVGANRSDRVGTWQARLTDIDLESW